MSRVVEDYSKEIADSLEVLKRFNRSVELFKKDADVLELEKERYKLVYSQVHLLLSPQKTENAEKEIQKIIHDIIMFDIRVSERKVQRFSRALEKLERSYGKDKEQNLELCYKYLQEWLILFENFWALASFRSLEHFAQFMEWELPDKQKVWKYSLDPYKDGGKTGVNKPFFFYFTRMVLKKDIKFISKQQPTGYGKSRTNQVAIAWLLGIDKDNDVLDVLGNPALVLTNGNGIVELMINPRFAQIFPEYQKYFDMGGNVKDNMFSVCRIKDGEITVEGSTRPLNIKIISKQTSIDGIRVKFLFLDDVCRSKDANNLKMHQEDIDNFWNSWYKRNYGTDNFYIVVGGTAYSVEDILSHLIRYYSKGKMYKTLNEQAGTGNKYTFKNKQGDCVFIKIPKIDDDLNRSTYPQKFPYDEAIKARERNLRSFMAMEQQQPMNPETSPLAWEKIQTYSEIPNDLSEYAQACLDPARSGRNYVTMGIHKIRKELDKYGVEIEKHYLVDCVFELKKMEDVYDQIVEKIEKHNIRKLHVENNTDTSLKYLLEKMLHEKGIMYCDITESYSTQNKENKIAELVYSNEALFQNQMVYPAFGMYAPSHPMGKFMQYITCYDYKEKMEYDDSIDEECMYLERFVKGKLKNNKAKIIYV